MIWLRYVAINAFPVYRIEEINGDIPALKNRLIHFITMVQCGKKPFATWIGFADRGRGYINEYFSNNYHGTTIFNFRVCDFQYYLADMLTQNN
jgi:hypothetical protein